MRIEVDVSSRLEQSGDTIFGFSDGIQRVVRLPQQDRDLCLAALTGGKFARLLLLYAACLYLLLRDHIDELERAVIDDEYPGHGGTIKRHLVNLIKRHYGAKFNDAIIEVRRIGEKRPAHDVAWQTLRGKRKANKRLKPQKILKLLYLD